jgi:hypothetical protein
MSLANVIFKGLSQGDWDLWFPGIRADIARDLSDLREKNFPVAEEDIVFSLEPGSSEPKEIDPIEVVIIFQEPKRHFKLGFCDNHIIAKEIKEDLLILFNDFLFAKKEVIHVAVNSPNGKLGYAL